MDNLIKKRINNTNEYSFGKLMERTLLSKIQNKFGKDIQLCINKFQYYDYFNNNYLIELKARKKYSYDYDTIFLNKSKISSFINSDDINKKNFIFVANWIDCDKFIIYDKDKFNKYDIEVFQNKNKNYVDILIKVLISDMTDF